MLNVIINTAETQHYIYMIMHIIIHLSTEYQLYSVWVRLRSRAVDD